MDWEAAETTVQRVKEMLRQAFLNAGQYIKLVDVEHSLVELICKAPTWTISSLVLMARNNTSVLRKQGVVKLTIGREVILDDLAVRKCSLHV